MKLRTQILLFFLLFALTPLITAVLLNLPLVLGQMELFYHKAYLQNLRADFRDLDQHLASREEMMRLLAKLPEPGTLLDSDHRQDEAAIDTARARYTEWINQVLRDQLDIIEIVFFDEHGDPRFWLERDISSQEWRPTVTRPQAPNEEFIHAGMQGKPGAVLVSPISLNPRAGADDPRRFMTLRLLIPITGQDDGYNLGAIMMSIDVGGIASYYRNTLWVNNEGRFLQQANADAPRGDAFARFPGLQEIFAKGQLALWKDAGQQIIWVPLFRTEQSGALWVGRKVDPSPIAAFRNALTLRVLSIVFALAIAVWLAARWLAKRADGMSKQLIEGVQRVLIDEQDLTFNWRGPTEVRQLGESLSRLSAEHTRNLRNLQEHARKLEESNRYKSEFLANVSHELRTPLNSILLLSKLLTEKNSGLGAEQVKQARVIHEAGSDLKALIDNILDLSRIEARRSSISLDRIDLQQLAHELLEMVNPQFAAKGLQLTLETGDDAPAQIYSDPDKIRQILKNFLSNAVKFTDKGSVTLRIDGCTKSPAHDCDLAISVRDTGIGIAKGKQEHIFEAFRQADGSTSRRYGGTGLGLAISQQLAHLLGGRIELLSGEGEGSTFSLLLPLEFDRANLDQEQLDPGPADQAEDVSRTLTRPRAESMTPATEDQIIAGHKILLVDDDVRNLLALTPLLEGWGLSVTAAGDGYEALEVLEDEEFSLVLMDIMMPELDGYDTIRRIRGDARLRDLSVIALTAKTEDKDREACLEAGADDFIAKPIDAGELKQLIARHLPFRPS